MAGQGGVRSHPLSWSEEVVAEGRHTLLPSPTLYPFHTFPLSCLCRETTHVITSVDENGYAGQRSKSYLMALLQVGYG